MRRDGLDQATAALDRAIEDREDHIQQDLADAVRRIVAVRDRLIAERRRGIDPGDRLARLNAVLSHVVAGEYPLAGIRRQRIEEARDELAAIADSIERG